MLNRKLMLLATIFSSLAAPALAQEEVTEVGTLVVTGTRLPATTFDTPAPVQVIDADSAAAKGLFDAVQVLQTQPIALGSVQQTSLVTGSIESGGPGISTLSLRGLGDQRTLVLLNGRRVGPAGVQGQVGAVDLNVLPSAIIQRYEILKDGASAVYGSDAVAGVVNIITRELDGGLLMADGTLTEAGGGGEYAISGAYGADFARGHFEVSAEWRHREALKLGDRDFLSCGQRYTFDPATGERNDLIDPATGQRKCISTTGNNIGYVNVYEAITDGASLFPVLYSRLGPISAFGAGSGPDPYLSGFRAIPLAERDYNPQAEDDTTVLSPSDRYTVFAQGRVSAGFVEGYGEFLWTRRETEQKDYQTIFQPVTPGAPCVLNPLTYGCPGGSTMLPPPYAFNPSVTTPGFFHVGFAPLSQFLAPNEDSQRVDFARSVVGLRGETGLGDWDWDASVTYSRSRGEYTRTGIYSDRIQYTVGTDLNGLPLSAGLCPAAAPAGCAPLNFFTDEILTTGLLPQSYLDYLQIRETGQTHYDQVVAEAVVTGTLFQAPAGAVQGALGVSFRKDWLDDRPGREAVAGNYWGTATAGPTKGDDSVWEAFGEVRLPLVEGAAWAREVTLSLSGRLSDYDSYGTNGTYRAGLNWRVVDDVRVRATLGTSFRAPALYEMSLNNQTAFLPQAVIDPCINWGDSLNQGVAANCMADGLASNFAGGGGAATLLIGGGSDLEPEESTSRSLGVVWTARGLGANLALDYWEVDIDNEVTSLASAVIGQCYTAADFPDSPFCDLFTRAATGTRAITFVDASYRNVVNQKTRGLDLTANAARDLGPGAATVDLEATWTLEDKRELFPGRVDDINGVIGQPRFVAQASVGYEVDSWTALWSADFIGEQSNAEYQFGSTCGASDPFVTGGGAFCAKNHVEPVWYHHASLRYEADSWSLTGGVRNLFDEQPPAVSPALEPDMGEATYSPVGTTPGTSQYDLLGRRLFVGVKKTF